MYRIFSSTLLAIGMASFAAPVLAADPGWYIKGGAGFAHVNDSDSAFVATGASGTTTTTCNPGGSCTTSVSGGGSAKPNEFDLKYDNGAVFGAAFGYDTLGGLRGEVELLYSKNEFDEIQDQISGAPVTVDANGEIKSTAMLVNLWWDFNAGGDLQPYIGGGAGATRLALDSYSVRGSTTPAFSGHDTVYAWQLGLGLSYSLTDTFAADVGYRYFVAGDPSYPEGGDTIKSEYTQHLALLSLRWVFLPVSGDRDGDGVPDEFDRCPDTPAGTDVDAHGCPRDSDGDGVPDALDRCPNTPAGVPVGADGCALDSDGDGVPDYKDQCPNTPAGTPVDIEGCPLVIDTDGDGVPDDRDLCPDTPAGQPVLTNGCGVSQGVVLKGVNFEYDTATLTQEAETVLASVTQTLKDSPGFNVEVAGHTDSKGTDAYNLDLSQRRADAVVDFLVNHGVDRERLIPVGYGETRPIAQNNLADGSDNAEGRAKNRRVELNVLSKN